MRLMKIEVLIVIQFYDHIHHIRGPKRLQITILHIVIAKKLRISIFKMCLTKMGLENNCIPPQIEETIPIRNGEPPYFLISRFIRGKNRLTASRSYGGQNNTISHLILQRIIYSSPTMQLHTMCKLLFLNEVVIEVHDLTQFQFLLELD